MWKRYPEPDGTVAWVMVGNPRVLGQAHRRPDGQLVEALTIKANLMVVWVDERAMPDLARLLSSEPGPARPAGERSVLTAVFEDAVLGIYAEGAVEVVYGRLAFRAQSLYLEPRTYRGLLVEPRFDGHITGLGAPDEGLPLYVTGRRARLVAKGLIVFDDAEVMTSRADDRLAMRVRTLTVEEYEQEQASALGQAPALLGFQSPSTQRYRARDITLWGERLPLARIPYVSLGVPGQDAFPVTIKRLTAGERSNLGFYALVGLGGNLGPEEDRWGEWIVDLGGYTKRGPAAGGELRWGDGTSRSRGKVESRMVFLDNETDRNGYDAPDGFRGRLVGESRTRVRDDLLLDAEVGLFTDRGFNREFFEREDLTHKDRETYARALWRPGTWAATVTGKAHPRAFVTETLEAPEAGLWGQGLPLLRPGTLGGLGLDLTTVSRAGWLGRRFDEALGFAPYDAFRTETDTRLEAGVDVGDVRLSAWLGGAAASYQGRTDGGEDLTRTALLAGVRANLQASRVTAARGGPLELDGVRHVIDVDVEAGGRFRDSHEVSEVPFFDEREQEEERSAIGVRLRNRWQTRRAKPGELRDVLDLETWFRWHTDDVAPYLQRRPWSGGWSLRAEPRAGSRLLLSTEGDVDGTNGITAAIVSAEASPTPRVGLALAYRYLQDDVSAPLVRASWQWSDKYALRVTESYNFRDGKNDLVFLLRRNSNDHVWFFGIRLRGSGDVGFEFDFRPNVSGEVGDGQSAFADQVDLDPTRAFR
jgi:hypothetical protein